MTDHETFEVRCPHCDEWLASRTVEYTAEEREAMQKLHDPRCPSVV